MKIKVIPFGVTKSHYCIKYKYKWYTPWERLTYLFKIGNDPSLWSLDQPYLFTNFEDAVSFAKTLSKEKIKELQDKSKKEFQDALSRAEKRLELRNKSFEIEV